eukprot:2696907-Lingulodinium_polyedra.AAC.1
MPRMASWLVNHIVSEIFKVDQAELEPMPNKTEDCMNLLAWAIQALEQVMLPVLKMQPSQVLVWAKARAAFFTKLLNVWRPSLGTVVGWNMGIGVYPCVFEVGMVSSIRHNISGVIKVLPSAWQCCVKRGGEQDLHPAELDLLVQLFVGRRGGFPLLF